MAIDMPRTRSARPAGRARGHKLQRLLGEQHGMLHTRKEALRQSISTGMFGVIDDEEHSLDDEELGIDIAVLEITSRAVQGLEGALRRVAAGEYGICSDCRARIASARLQALPFAERCRDCQEQRDLVERSTKLRAAAARHC